MPLELCSLEYLAFIGHVEAKAALRGMIGIRPIDGGNAKMGESLRNVAKLG